MSRTGLSSGPTNTDSENDKDRCPYCSSTRYMNKNLKLLTNSVCYHRLCETCADRLFGPGPRACPYVGCGRTIRRLQFRVPTFDDLKIEREVDIRRRVGSVFNRRQEEFVDLRSWNDYLENVEELTFNLLYNLDVEETEAKLASYASQNAESIKQNKLVEEQERLGLVASLEADRQQRKMMRQESQQEDEERREERIREDREAQNRIRRGLDPKGAFKQDVARKRAAPVVKVKQAPIDNGAPIFEIQGLKPTAAPEMESSFDPFGGYSFKMRYYDVGEVYEHAWLENARKDTRALAGGYDTDEYRSRALMEAFSGLGVFIEDKKEDGAMSVS